MGYGLYDLHDGFGERGYSVEDVCHADGCETKIDRGLAYLCYGCTRYFCEAHRTFADEDFDCFAGESSQSCEACAADVAETDDNEGYSPTGGIGY